MFTPLFIEALAWKLASDLAIPLRGKIEQQNTFFGYFTSIVDIASSENSNQEEQRPKNVNTILNSRD